MESNNEKPKSFLSNKVYDILKIVAAVLPLLGAFYYGLAEIWGLPYGGPVQATIALIASTLSAILVKLSYDYRKINANAINNIAADTDILNTEVPAEPEETVDEVVEEVSDNNEEETVNE